MLVFELLLKLFFNLCKNEFYDTLSPILRKISSIIIIITPNIQFKNTNGKQFYKKLADLPASIKRYGEFYVLDVNVSVNRIRLLATTSGVYVETDWEIYDYNGFGIGLLSG